LSVAVFYFLKRFFIASFESEGLEKEDDRRKKEFNCLLTEFARALPLAAGPFETLEGRTGKSRKPQATESPLDNVAAIHLVPRCADPHFPHISFLSNYSLRRRPTLVRAAR